MSTSQELQSRIQRAVERHGYAKVCASLGLSEGTIGRLLSGGRGHRSTKVAAEVGLERLERGSVTRLDGADPRNEDTDE